MSAKCERCTVGMIGHRWIFEGDWQSEAAEFDLVIKDWNEKTKHHAIPHPGFVNKFEYCPNCGHKVNK